MELRSIKDFYKYYKNNNSLENTLSIQDFRKITYDFNTYVMKQVLSGHEVTLPSRTGRLLIQGSKYKIRKDENGNIKGLRIDWATTKKMWEQYPEKKEKKELFYFFNEHSEGINYSFKWFKSGVLLTNKYFYTFIPSRHNKRVLAQLVKSGTVEYILKN